MTPQQFIHTYRQVTLSERSACQSHFNDLCELLGQPKPVHADPEGAWYTFERGVQKTAGGQGWADVWMKGHFGWEYKKKKRDLKAAYDQLLQYREDLENPPLLVVCDLDRFEVHTNFTGTAKQVYAFDLEALADEHNLDVLRKLFTDPDALKPGQTPEGITEQVAQHFGKLADGLKTRGIPAHQASHFLMKLMFCMFAEDIGLLGERRLTTKGGPDETLFTRLLRSTKGDPAKLARQLREFFTAMASGGDFWGEDILHFNGGLFHDADVIDLEPAEIQYLLDAAIPDWENVEPSIFGTLFERILDPNKRSQLGAHYTSRADIETLLEPVVMQPLRREWDDVRAQCEKLARKSPRAASRGTRTRKAKLTPPEKRLREFLERLAHVTILDPACGSGNFLYVALHLLLDLEKEVIGYAARQGIGLFPQVRPTQLAGIEINPYAQELASVVIWIGYLQWMHHNGFNPPANPVLEPIESIHRMDAILDLSDPEHPLEPEWPPAEFIVGNPPFLGNRMIQGQLGAHYVNALANIYSERLGGKPDLCCYWYERARSQITNKHTKRCGLLATQGIRGGTNRRTLELLKSSGDIFFAVSDRDWVLDGANVHVSLIGFDDGTEQSRILDGNRVAEINSNLTSNADITRAGKLQDNLSVSFQGAIARGKFDVSHSTACGMLLAGGNPHGRPNSDVLVPCLNGMDITRRPRDSWIVRFPQDSSESDASCYVEPFDVIKAEVQPARQGAAQAEAREFWWKHWRPRTAMFDALSSLHRFVVTPTVSKFRVFSWVAAPAFPDHQLI